MCGINGLLTNSNELNLNKYINLMNESLIHRGPDDEGIWIAHSREVALGFRRLSIIDLTNNAHQPMRSLSGRYTMVFNGEIYNYKEIKDSLNIEFKNAINWCSTSDSETLIEAFDRWGIIKTLNNLVGMFAIALWDNINEKLHLIRDRVGEKPLYYGWINNENKKLFAFSSELKAFKKIPLFNNKISKLALSKYLQLRYIPAPFSIYEDIYKLEPGCLLTIDKSDYITIPNSYIKTNTSFHNISILKWWNKDSFKSNDLKSKFLSENETKVNLENAILNSVSLQMEADVNSGAFLSGGIDSSLIASSMQRLSSKKIQTFTIGFNDSKFDESIHAKEIAKVIGCNNYVQTITSNDSLKIIDKLPFIYDEPFADSSQIPTILLSIFAKQKVSVALTGDGADELFGGYDRYLYSYNLWTTLNLFPYEVRKILGNLSLSLPINKYINFLKSIKILNNDNEYKIIKKIKNISNKLIEINTFKDLDFSLKSTNINMKELYKYYEDVNDSLYITEGNLNQYKLNDKKENIKYMMDQDFNSYLPDDILCKVDRAAMFSSLENRVPFLDHRIIELSENIPFNMKFRNNINKWILKEIAYNHIPKSILDRAKKGFSIPIDDWLRGPLLEWADNLLNEKILENQGYFNSNKISIIWNEHKLNISNHGSDLWTILMFQAWLESDKIH